MPCTRLSIAFPIKFKFSVLFSLFSFPSLHPQLPTISLCIFMTLLICFCRSTEFNQDDLCVHVWNYLLEPGGHLSAKLKTITTPLPRIHQYPLSHCLWRTRGNHCDEMTVIICQSCPLKSYLQIVQEDNDKVLRLSVVCDDWILLGHSFSKDYYKAILL